MNTRNAPVRKQYAVEKRAATCRVFGLYSHKIRSEIPSLSTCFLQHLTATDKYIRWELFFCATFFTKETMWSLPVLVQSAIRPAQSLGGAQGKIKIWEPSLQKLFRSILRLTITLSSHSLLESLKITIRIRLLAQRVRAQRSMNKQTGSIKQK